MKRTIITTKDGSKTIHIPSWNEQYHSIHGAIQEAKHVFLKNGLQYYFSKNKSNSDIKILEIGFGTGLNTFLTFLEANKKQRQIQYTGVEAYPVSKQEIQALNYIEVLQATTYQDQFIALHTCDWEKQQQIASFFKLTKQQKLFSEINEVNYYNIIYFDAFGARVQPELWTESMFKIMYTAMQKQAVLVTYAAKGSVRRAMQAVGFTVERLPGPPGKREMLRATKS